ncbi:MAG: hypothetical protein P1U86_05150 [Verrucomicrobiales bacterium]|nr:hypothetical protein [Verrucomicrobiales bacterium]
MLKSLYSISLSLLAGFPLAISAQESSEPLQIAITQEPSTSKSPAMSKGFTIKQLSFDSSGSVAEEKEKSGVLFSSYKPGAVWSGELPPFFEKSIVIGGEDEFPITDVTSSGRYLFGYYGSDHYETRVVSVVDQNRHNPFEFTAYGSGDISFCVIRDGVLYYSVVEGNIGEKQNARLYAFSIEEEKQLWKSDSGVAHGNFIVRENHILTHYGFTAEDDFLCVIDRGNGKTLKKEKLKTAVNRLIEEEDGAITVPAYTGVYRYSFTENE